MVPSRIRSSSNHKKTSYKQLAGSRTVSWKILEKHNKYTWQNFHSYNSYKYVKWPKGNQPQLCLFHREKSAISVVLEASCCLPHKIQTTSLTFRSDVFSTSPGCFSNKTFHWQGVKNYKLYFIYIYRHTVYILYMYT